MNKWLLIRYAPGSAGRMLASLLSTHPEIASWNNTDYDDLLWFKNCYPGNFDKWMVDEPYDSWKLNQYISAKYPRGDNLDSLPITLPQMWLPFVWHKEYVAKFMTNYFTINIELDPPSHRWYHKSRWKKNFRCKKTATGYTVYNLSHAPNPNIQLQQKFDNQYEINIENLHGWLKHNIINAQEKQKFLGNNNIKPGVAVKLSDLLVDPRPVLHNIANQLCIDKHNWDVAYQMWVHWKKLHNY